MTWMVTSAALILWSTAALALAVAWLALRHEPFPGRRVFACLMLAVAEWSLAAGFAAAWVHPMGKIAFSVAEYVGLAATPILFLTFAARHSGYDHWLRGKHHLILWIPSFATLALAATNGMHHWLWAEYLPGPPGTNSLIFVHGPAYYAVAALVYAFVLAGCSLVARAAIHRSGQRRRQAVTILLASAFPLAIGILYVFDVSLFPGLDLIPVSFFVTGLVFLVGVGFFRVFDLVPAARNAFVEQTLDAVIVVDADGRIVDANPTSVRWFGQGKPLAGSDSATVFNPWPVLRSACRAAQDYRMEVTLTEDPLHHVDARITPMRAPHGEPAGCFVVLRDITARYRNELELHRANEQLANHLHEIEALHDELRERAIRDGLTGLFNRRYLDEILPRELGRAAHEGSVLSVVMIDIDHFKMTNDRRGHREGDRLLTLLGHVLREGIRPTDIACRYGGEEFLLVLPDVEPETAYRRMERLRVQYATRLRIEGFDAPPTLSAGIAAFPTHAQSDDQLLRVADRALYRAKAAGRDRVCVAEPADIG